jgi:3-dehydroquinate synthetase
MAEVLKHGAIADAEYFKRASHAATAVAGTTPNAGSEWWTSADAEQLVLRSVEIKSAIVAADERESGQRESLNFGHTVAHAIELVSEYQTLHGHAVSVGMIVEALAAEDLGVAEQGLANTLRTSLAAAGLPSKVAEALNENRLIETMRGDKKARGGEIRCAVPSKLGVMTPVENRWSVTVPEDVMREALRAANSGTSRHP